MPQVSYTEGTSLLFTVCPDGRGAILEYILNLILIKYILLYFN